MPTLYRRLYHLILRMHPAAFRNEFAHDMALDFEDALSTFGLARLLLDATRSLARQWSASLISPSAPPTQMPTRPLLAGNYAQIHDEPMRPLELARGLLASATLLALCLFAFHVNPGHAPNLSIVYAATRPKPTPGLPAQSTTAPERHELANGKMSFDVASVKQNLSGFADEPTLNVGLTSGDGDSHNGGYFSATNQELSTYILFAYKMSPLRLSAVRNQLPDWAKTARFDIEARADGNPTKDQMRVMMQSLLADRFKLAAHTETRETQVYSLVLAKPGRMGPHLRPHAGQPQCSTASLDEHDPGLIPTIPGGYPVQCGELLQLQSSVPGDVRFAARAVGIQRIAEFANDLSNMGQLDRPVNDRTGLAGTFDFNLEFMPTAGPNAPPPPPGGAEPDDMGQPFREALQKQLGLKLVPAKGPADTFVIDHVERPTKN